MALDAQPPERFPKRPRMMLIADVSSRDDLGGDKMAPLEWSSQLCLNIDEDPHRVSSAGQRREQD